MVMTTIGKKMRADVEGDLKKSARQSEQLQDQFTELIERDTHAFIKVMEAYALPKDADPAESLRLQQCEGRPKRQRWSLWR